MATPSQMAGANDDKTTGVLNYTYGDGITARQGMSIQHVVPQRSIMMAMATTISKIVTTTTSIPIQVWVLRR